MNIFIHPDTAETFKDRPGLAVLLTVIANKIVWKENRIKELCQEIIDEIQQMENTIILLRDFENRHIKELSEIYPQYNIHNVHKVKSLFLMWPINNLLNHIEHHRMLLENPNNFYHELKDLYGVPEGFACVSIPDFEEITRLSTKIIKDLLSELERRDLIQRKRLMGGYGYRITENIYIERARNI